jgi:2-dehydro-3-deoxyphosphogluconate aldolase/(4S)-4-hydroxy-2-oxoglutarate aldolase
VFDPTAIEGLRRSPVADLIRSRRLIAILRHVEPQARLLELVETLAADGVRIFEVIFDAPTSGDDLVAARERLVAAGHTDAIVGAGTVRTPEALDRAIDAGAAFVVGPTLDPAIVARSIDRGIPVVPGAYSPTEIAFAWDSGATFVKVFPASSLGPAHVREIRGPLPDIEMIATGGIDAGSAKDFLAAGCVAVGVGGALTKAGAADRRAIVSATSDP